MAPIKTSWQRLIRFTSTAEPSLIQYGEPVGPLSLDVGLAALEGKLKARIIEGNPLDGARVTQKEVKVGRLLCPLPPDQIGAARALGANYGPPGKEPPPVHIVFFKPQSSLADPQTPIRIPPARQEESDFENELVIVIGKTCNDVTAEEALDYVLGYTLCNDVTARKTMTVSNQWGMAKAHDTWLPIGPCIVSSSVITDPQQVQLITHLNGEKMQDDSTAKMLFNVRDTVAALSIGATLHPGAIICTGSPAGFGASRDPPRFLRHGDEVRCSANHGLGTLVNKVDFDRQDVVLKSKL